MESFRSPPGTTVGTIVEDVYTLRDHIAHGDRVPDVFFQRTLRAGITEGVSMANVLLEALSFIIRKSLLRIVQEDLLQHFAGPASSEAYFGGAGLTNTAIRARGGSSQP